MKRFIFLTILALGILAILLFIFNPELLEKIWLWIIGLIGLIVSALKSLINGIANLFKGDDDNPEAKQAAALKAHHPENKEVATSPGSPSDPALTQLYKDKIAALEDKVKMLQEEPDPAEVDDFKGTTLTVLRYFDDGETTLGLLFIDGKYFSYTLEDAYRAKKIRGKTRIPKGTYMLDFNRHDTKLTLKYRKTRPWFHYHLHVKNVKGFEGIYIHSGSTHEHTEGCLLVAKSIHANSAQKIIYDSKVTFEELYKNLKKKLDAGERVRIKYFDEDFLSSFESLNKAS